jgi:hypothetical protein
MDRLKRLDPILIQAIIAAALSFAHIHDIAEAAGQGGWKAWAYPVSVDLLLVVAWRRMRTRGDAAGWFWFLTAMAASLGANVATSGTMDLTNPPTWLRVIVAGWPAIAFLGGTLLVHSNRVEKLAVTGAPELPPMEPQTAAQEPAEEADREADPEPLEEPQETDEKPYLISYADAADTLDVAPETVRGWAAQGKIRRYQGPTPKSVLVDLRECKTVKSRRLVGA